MNSICKGPLLLLKSKDADSVQQYSQKLSYLYDELIISKIVNDNEYTYYSMYCLLDLIDYKYLKELAPETATCIMNKKLILKSPYCFSSDIFQSLCFSQDQYEHVHQQTQLTLQKLQAAPCLIINFSSIQQQQAFIKNNCIYEHVYVKSFNLFSGFLYNIQTGKLSKLRRSSFLPQNCERFKADKPMKKCPNGIPVKIFTELQFRKEEWKQLEQIGSEFKKELEEFVGPKMLIMVEDGGAQKLIDQIQSIFASNVLKINTIQNGNSTHIGIIFSHKCINYNTLWYMIPKEYKRYVHKQPIEIIPAFIDQNTFNKLKFTKEQYIEIESQHKLENNNCQRTVPPIIIIKIERNNAEKVFNLLNDKFKPSHCHCKLASTRIGDQFIGLIFKEPLLGMNAIKPTIKSYNYIYNQDFITMCPDFIPNSCYNDLHFSQTLWQSLRDMADFVSEKQKRHQKVVENVTVDVEEQVTDKQPLNTEYTINTEEQTYQQILIESNNIILTDFEAYITSKQCLAPSEFAAIRFVNNQPVAQFHSILAMSDSEVEKVRNQPQLSQQIKFVQKLTGIPIPGTEQYESLNKANNYEIVKKAFELFCFGSSDDLKQFRSNEISISCLEEFTSQQSRTLVSKGTSLEQKIFERFFQISEKVVDFGFLLGKRKVSIAQQKVYFQNIHSHSRKYKYCPFHESLENKNGVDGTMVHCALDDVWFLSDILSAVADGHTDLNHTLAEDISNDQDYEPTEQVTRFVIKGPHQFLSEALKDALENNWEAEIINNKLCIFSQFEQTQKVEAILNDQCKMKQFKENAFEEAVCDWFKNRQ
ncbi:Conserved_hypothetical protein [Hexamita inflata]|uniref:Uncharacterized protein n=1 Tax=Hexamita inflata TaxID=28002 RepID=A0AA86UST9_9EUKA|nr:Conserved hypothetical protein [Hexamita inflata]